MGCTGNSRSEPRWGERCLQKGHRGIKSSLKFHLCCPKPFPWEFWVLCGAVGFFLAKGKKTALSSHPFFSDLTLLFPAMGTTPGVTP